MVVVMVEVMVDALQGALLAASSTGRMRYAYENPNLSDDSGPRQRLIIGPVLDVR